MGISEAFYLQFVATKPIFKIQPLVVRNMSAHINLGAFFFFENNIVPQCVQTDQLGY